jgi:hypothetical protein
MRIKQLCKWGNYWRCEKITTRHCGICLPCCLWRDEQDRAIDAGLASYITPYHPLSEQKKAALAKATVARKANLARPIAK